jgi:hypothetical protein
MEKEADSIMQDVSCKEDDDRPDDGGSKLL